MSILSLPARVDRRRDMDTLRHLLGIPESEWEYTDAVASTDKRVLSVLDWIQYLRSTFVNLEPSHAPKYQFSWPNEKDINRLVKSDTALELWDTSPWISPFRKDPGPNSFSGSNSKANYPVVPCMIKDFSFPFSARNTTIPPHKILTPARIACWYSHLEAIQRIANSPVQHAEDTTIILEDDVDMESDIKEQLGMLWKNLPRHWDIVFLGRVCLLDLSISQFDCHRSLLVKRIIPSFSFTKLPAFSPQPPSLSPSTMHSCICLIPHRRATNSLAPSLSAICFLSRD